MPTKSNITDFICRHRQYLHNSTSTSGYVQNNYNKKNNQHELMEGLNSCCSVNLRMGSRVVNQIKDKEF